MNYIITQNGVLSLTEGNIFQDNSNHSVYEVIRVIDEIALFLEDHYERLTASVQMSGLQLEIGFSDFRQNITEMTKLNQVQNGNVKFILSEKGKKCHWSFSFIPHSYPTPMDYQKGVATGLLLQNVKIQMPK